LRLVSSKGDTTELNFKGMDQSTSVILAESQSWDYLGTDDVTLPSNTKYLVFDAEIQSVTRADSSNSKSYANIFTGKSFGVSILKGGKRTSVYNETAAQSGRKVVDISAFAGQTVSIRPTGNATRKSNETITVGVGNIFAPRK
jgi:hypothetical protein